MTFNQTLHYLHKINLDDILFSKYDDKNGTTMFTVANRFCKVLAINPSRIGRMFIKLKGNDSFNVMVNDPVNMNGFLISQMSGDKILLDNKDVNHPRFLVNFKVTEDKTGGASCVEYPNSRFQSLSQCIEDEIVEKTRPVFGFGLPFFSLANTTLKPLPRLEKHENTVKWLRNLATEAYGGTIYKSETCLPPCTFISAAAEEQPHASTKVRAVILYFNNIVEVQTTVLAYGVDSLLVEAGSSLGLWLGLSMVGVFDLITTAIEKLGKRIQHVRERFVT